MKQVKGRFERFAPRIRNKETGEVSTVGFMNYRYDGTIYHASDGYSYDSLMEEKGNTDNWKDINEIELLIPTGLYDDNEEMIYVASFEELHELFFKFMSLDKRFIEGISTKELVGIHEKYGKKEDKQ